MPSELSNLLRLSELDTVLSKLARTVVATERAIVKQSSHLDDLERQITASQKKETLLHEAEQSYNRKMRRYQSMIETGNTALERGLGDAASALKQVEQCSTILDELENQLLELFEQQETLATTLVTTTQASAQAKQEFPALQEQTKLQLTELATQQQLHATERKRVRATMNIEFLERYDLMRSRKGSPVAHIQNNACQICNQTVAQQQIHELRRERLEICRGCSRWLAPPID